VDQLSTAADANARRDVDVVPELVSLELPIEVRHRINIAVRSAARLPQDAGLRAFDACSYVLLESGRIQFQPWTTAPNADSSTATEHVAALVKEWLPKRRSLAVALGRYSPRGSGPVPYAH
jgi:hypothetical protein